MTYRKLVAIICGISWVAICGVIVCGVSVAADAVQGQKGQSWPMFRGNPQSTGTVEGALPEKLEVLWHIDIKNGAFEGTAAIVDGTVFLGDLDGVVRAIDLVTGKLRWE